MSSEWPACPCSPQHRPGLQHVLSEYGLSVKVIRQKKKGGNLFLKERQREAERKKQRNLPGEMAISEMST